MGSKAFLILGLFLAIFLMITSEVLARELAETSTTSEEDSKKSDNTIAEAPYGGYPGIGYPGSPICRYGCCQYGSNYNDCYRCCSYKGEAMDKVTEGKPHN